MPSWSIPLCESCRHLRSGADGFGHACDAFPDGIPDDVYPGGFDHRQPHDGDHGIRFELSDDAGADERLAAFEANQED